MSIPWDPRYGAGVNAACPGRVACAACQPSFWRVYLVVALALVVQKSGLRVSSRRGKQSPTNAGHLGQPRDQHQLQNLNPGFGNALGGGQAEAKAISVLQRSDLMSTY